MRFAELDAVTLDAYGTLATLVDPTAALARALGERGLERGPEEIAAAFRAEVAYYVPRSARGRDEASLAELRRECAGVFLEALGADLPAAEFAPAFVGALQLDLLPGVVETLARLRARGLELAVVADWDCSLPEHLAALGLDAVFSAVVTSAEAGVAKPDPAIFRLGLERLGVAPERALHVGDRPEDEQGGRAAGMRFAGAPLATAFEGWS